MNKLKLNYEQPCSEVLVVRFEGSMICNSPTAGDPGKPGPDDDHNNYPEDF